MKIAFFGTGEFSKNILLGILKDSSVKVSMCVSQPDKHIGRKKILTPTAVKSIALEKNIPILQPEKLKNNNDFFEQLRRENFDFILVVAYGKIVPIEVLKAAKYGCINIHGSILPQYRGASPIQEAVKNGDKKTGLTIMYMSEGMDEGDILTTQEFEIHRDDTTQDIFEKFQEIGPKLTIDTLSDIISGKAKGRKQDDTKATYCSKIEKQDGMIDFNKTAQQIYNQYKAYKIWPGIYTYYQGKKFAIEKCNFLECDILEEGVFEIGDIVEYSHHKKDSIGIVCGSGILILEQIKLEGKKSMDINSFINGNKDFLDYSFKYNEKE